MEGNPDKEQEEYRGVGSFMRFRKGNRNQDPFGDLEETVDPAFRSAGPEGKVPEKEERQKQNKEDKDHKGRKRRFYKRHWKGILISLTCFVLAAALAYGVWEIRKRIPVGYAAEDLIGDDYESVEHDLRASGFTNIETEAIRDLDMENIPDEDMVYQVYISGENSFSEETEYPYDAPIIIKYHAVKMLSAPISAKEAKGRYYKDIEAEFRSVGFGNIQTEAEYDLITGLLADDGEIESIAIDGKKKFDTDDKFRPDSKVIIIYHTFRK